MTTNGRRHPGQRGFTMIELMIATAMLGLVMAGLLGLLRASLSAYARGSNTIDAQQNARVALDRIAKEIREAGYHPRPPDTTPATCPPGSPGGLYPSGGGTNAPCWSFYPVINQSATGLTLQYDWNGDGVITTNAKVNDAITCPTGATCRGERVIYALTGQDLTRQEIQVDNTPQVIATGVIALTFTYWQDNNTTAPSLDLIRSVRILITAKAGTDGSSATMTDQIRLRTR
jgi:prepilin-type N-terminal cleavage/methylation domain-containing protein